MSRLLILLLLAVNTAHADCYSRNSVVSKNLARIERIADVQRALLPAENNQLRCRVTFRALIGDQWHTAEGETLGAADGSLDQICAQALNSGRANILTSVAGTSVSVTQDMVCTDQPIPKTAPAVNVGDTLQDSELPPHPQHRALFQHRGSTCRWFAESQPAAGKVHMTQGIICRAPEQTAWTVVDKW